jgi:hypothetical protein
VNKAYISILLSIHKYLHWKKGGFFSYIHMACFLNSSLSTSHWGFPGSPYLKLHHFLHHWLSTLLSPFPALYFLIILLILHVLSICIRCQNLRFGEHREFCLFCSLLHAHPWKSMWYLIYTQQSLVEWMNQSKTRTGQLKVSYWSNEIITYLFKKKKLLCHKNL